MQTIRHQLLEGVLLRLARMPDANSLILRGGMLLRHWFRPIVRSALDLDLIASEPLTIEGASERYLPIFSFDGIDDGVVYEADRIRVEAIWQHTANPGVRIHVRGFLNQRQDDLQIDITGGPVPRPSAMLGELSTLSGTPVRVRMCRPESIVGQKIQALVHLGRNGWRPKDLDDLRLLYEIVPLDNDLLREAVAVSMAEISKTLGDAKAVFESSSWWGMKLSLARWSDYSSSVRERTVPRDLEAVVSNVLQRMAPIWEGL